MSVYWSMHLYYSNLYWSGLGSDKKIYWFVQSIKWRSTDHEWYLFFCLLITAVLCSLLLRSWIFNILKYILMSVYWQWLTTTNNNDHRQLTSNSYTIINRPAIATDDEWQYRQLPTRITDDKQCDYQHPKSTVNDSVSTNPKSSAKVKVKTWRLGFP